MISCGSLIITYELYIRVNYPGNYSLHISEQFERNLFMQVDFIYIIVHIDCNTGHNLGEACNVSIKTT